MTNAAQSINAQAENLLRLAGYNPVFAQFSADATELQAEWESESDARSFADEYCKHKNVIVENVPDIGWCTRLFLGA